MSNNASSRGGNSNLTVHHSQVTGYLVIYKQFTVGQFANAPPKPEGMHTSLHLLWGAVIYNTENKKFNNEQNKEGVFRVNFSKYFSRGLEQLLVLLAMAESSEQQYLELLLTELMFGNRFVGRLLTSLTTVVGICFREAEVFWVCLQ